MTISYQDFWCDDCQRDYFSQYSVLRGAGDLDWWIHKHECRTGTKELIRYATQPLLDPYWRKSKHIRMEAVKHEKDLVQPSDPRFAKLYPAQYEQIKKDTQEATKRIKHKEEKDWKYDKKIKETFGKKGKDALKVADEHIHGM